ncbi:MAG: YpsA SLOG family protein [Thermodesulfobacteriota bacterium]
MIKKMISGGAGGVGRAALDVAIKLDLEYGGWLDGPAGEMNPGNLERYHLKRVALSEQLAAEKNLLDSDGALVLSDGDLSGDLSAIISASHFHHKPCLYMDLGRTGAFDAAQEISSWAESHAVEVLYVAGPKGQDDGRMYTKVMNLLETVIYMGMIEANFWKTEDQAMETLVSPPRTVDEAVERLAGGLALKDRAIIANMTASELPSLDGSLGEYIHRHFGLWNGNTQLLESCRFVSKRRQLGAESAAGVIIEALWRQLRQTHKLRLVK